MKFWQRVLRGRERLASGREHPVRGMEPFCRAGNSASWKRAWQAVCGACRKLLALQQVRVGSRRLRLIEKVALGEKQFVALLEIDGVRFLASSRGGMTPMPSSDPYVPLQTAPVAQAMQSVPLLGELDSCVSAAGATVHAGAQTAQQGSDGPDTFALPAKKRTRSAAQRVQVLREMTARAEVAAASSDPAPPGKKQPQRPRKSKATAAQALGAGKKRAPRTRKGAPAVEPALRGEKQPQRPRKSKAAPALGAEKKKRAPRTRKRAPAVVAAEAAGGSTPVPATKLAAVPPKPQPRRPGVAGKQGEAASASPAQIDEPQQAAAANGGTMPGAMLGRMPGATLDEEDISAENNFAALLEIRMLAEEVFGQVDRGGETPEGRPPAPARPEHTPRRPMRGESGLSRLRRRFVVLPCLLAMFLLLQGAAHAQGPRLPSPVLQAGLALRPPVPAGMALALLAPAPLAPAGSGDIRISGLGGSSASWGIVVLLTLLTLIPSLLMCMTPFARLLVVFHFLRQALGLQTTPSNQTLIGLSLILTFFLMQPVGEVIYRDAVLPVQAGKMTPLDGVVRAGEPVRHFMARFVREKDAALFLEIAKEPRPHSIEDLSFRVLLPAYILSELKSGFQIGAVLFLPFLIVDMVVASITTSVGMMQLPPVVISTPLKLLLFLMVDGWHLLISALMRSFN